MITDPVKGQSGGGWATETTIYVKYNLQFGPPKRAYIDFFEAKRIDFL